MSIKNSDITLALTIINGLLSLAGNIYQTIAQIKGDQPIPTWEELVTKNVELQAKIDAEKDVTP